eukprot:TRINITY_DN3724_c3_g2_i1.p1 TRINITY_DN3724_c3_g2~~TRINITY_DN3724_c3_g2_i1.p1  ORF type:complete len:1339 (+),score=489.26 TRINITY_DN3724_c3_g2_i1:85-4017(+)
MPPKTTKSSSSGGKSSRKRMPSPKKSPRRGRAQRLEPAEAGAALFNCLTTGGAFTSDIDRMVDAAGGGQNSETIAELLNMLVVACGADGEITVQHVTEESPIDVLNEIVARLPEEQSKYPLVSSEKKWKKFQANWVAFWRQLASRSGAALVMSEDFYDVFAAWLEAFSDSRARAVRHQTIVAVYAIITGISENLKELAEAAEALGKKAGKVKELAAKDAKKRKLTERVNDLGERTFQRRWRDTLPDIRIQSMLCLGVWASHHDGFLVPTWTKYVGWALYDREAGVRLAALETLASMFSYDTAYDQLRSFAVRFEGRARQMCMDVNAKVQCAAIDLMREIVKSENHNEVADPLMLQEGAVGQVLALIADEKQCVRVRVAQFLRLILKIRVLNKYPEARPEEQLRRRAELFIVQIVQGPGKTHPRCAELFVDALYHHNGHHVFEPVHRFVEIVLAADPAKEVGLPASMNSEVAGTTLQTILAIVQVAQGKLDLSYGVKEDDVPKRTKRDQKLLDEAWQKIQDSLTPELARMLPEVLPRRMDEARTVTVCRILCGVSNKVWSQGKAREKGFRAVLATIQSLLTTEVKENVLTAVCAAWRHLCSGTHTLAEDARKAWRATRKALVKKLADKPTTELWRRFRTTLQEALEWAEEPKAVELSRSALEKCTVADAETPEVVRCAMFVVHLLTHSALREENPDPLVGLPPFVVKHLCRLCRSTDLADHPAACHQILTAVTLVWTVTRHPDLPDSLRYVGSADEEKAVVRGLRVFMVHAKEELRKPAGSGLQAQADRLELERDITGLLTMFVRLFACNILAHKYVGCVFQHWPSMHTRGQQVIGELWKHCNYLIPDSAWEHDCTAIQLAHKDYMSTGDEPDDRDTGKLWELNHLTMKFVQVQTFTPDLRAIRRLFETMITYAEERDGDLPMDSDDTNTHVLSALVPYCRFVGGDPGAARDIIGRIADCKLRGCGKGHDRDSVANQNRSVLVHALARAGGFRDSYWDSSVYGQLSASAPPKPAAPGATRAPSPVPRSSAASQRLFDDEDSDDGLIGRKARRGTGGPRTETGSGSAGRKVPPTISSDIGGSSLPSDMFDEVVAPKRAASAADRAAKRRRAGSPVTEQDDGDDGRLAVKAELQEERKFRRQPSPRAHRAAVKKEPVTDDGEDDDEGEDEDDFCPSQPIRGKGKGRVALRDDDDSDDDEDEALPPRRPQIRGKGRVRPAADDSDESADERLPARMPRGKGKARPAIRDDDDSDDAHTTRKRRHDESPQPTQELFTYDSQDPAPKRARSSQGASQSQSQQKVSSIQAPVHQRRK